MASTPQQQLPIIFLSICLMFVLLLIKVDSVNTTTVSLDDGNENMLRQQQSMLHQHPIDNNMEEPNYFMDHTKQSTVGIVTKNTKKLEINDNDENSKENWLNDDLTKTQSIFGHSYDPIQMVKRAPGGFVGMRGKKLYEGDKYFGTVSDNDNEYTFPWNQLQSSDEDFNWDEYIKANIRRYKKAPTAFYGVRGKKFASVNGGSSNSDNNRWQNFLQKLEEDHVRDAILQEFIERMAGTNNELQNEMAKRAPTGFTGVRGKRPSFDEVDSSVETLAKRGLGSNAFVGVRGKKDVSHQTFKRSPSAAERYFFVFWKKSLPIVGSKRQRFVDFNNKFVAVRGKKSSYNSLNGFNYINANRPPSTSAMSLFYSQRTPNGFVGMGGKRPFTTDDELSTQ